MSNFRRVVAVDNLVDIFTGLAECLEVTWSVIKYSINRLYRYRIRREIGNRVSFRKVPIFLLKNLIGYNA